MKKVVVIALTLLVAATALPAGAAEIFAVAGITNSVAEFLPTRNKFLGDFASRGDSLGIAYGQTCTPDGRLLVTEENYDSIQVYDGTTGAYVGPLVAGGSLNNPTGILWSKRGTILVSNRDSGEILEYAADGRFIRSFAQYLGWCFTLAYGPNGNIFVSTDSGVVEVNATTGAQVRTIGLTGARGLAFGAGGHLFASSCYVDSVEYAYNKKAGEWQQVRAYPFRAHGVLVSPDGKTLYLGLDSGLARFSTATGAYLSTLDAGAALSFRDMIWAGGSSPCGP